MDVVLYLGKSTRIVLTTAPACGTVLRGGLLFGEGRVSLSGDRARRSEKCHASGSRSRATGGVYALALTDQTRLDGPLDVSGVWLAVAFLGCELFALRVERTHGESYGFTLAQVPLAVGLVYAEPGALVAARVAAVVVAMLIVRIRRPHEAFTRVRHAPSRWSASAFRSARDADQAVYRARSAAWGGDSYLVAAAAPPWPSTRSRAGPVACCVVIARRVPWPISLGHGIGRDACGPPRLLL